MSEIELYRLIGENITKYLKLNDKTRQELADYMGVSHVTVSYWCNGQKMPRMDKIDRICKFFGINRSDLMGSDDPSAENNNAPVLSPSERHLLGTFRKLDADDRAEVVHFTEYKAAAPKYSEERKEKRA